MGLVGVCLRPFAGAMRRSELVGLNAAELLIQHCDSSYRLPLADLYPREFSDSYDRIFLVAGLVITQVKKSVTIDWTLRESARARIKVMVKRILNKHGYPPDLQEEAVNTVLVQAELLCAEWV